MEPISFVNAWRLLNIGVLIQLWLLGDSRISSFILILLLLAALCLRWRYAVPVWTIAFDIAVCALCMPFAPISAYGMAMPIFELALSGRWVPALLLGSAVFFISPSSGSLLFWHFLQAGFFGVFAYVALHNQETYRQEADEERKARYELERVRLELLEAYQAAAHQAELTERYRISRMLHDHLGHDLTGASLALQAYEVVQDDEAASQLLEEVRRRLEKSMRSLRETVHNMTPTAFIGVESLEQIVQGFNQIAIRFEKSGDMWRIPAHQWALLAACLKEALTNAARHSNATLIEADLHVMASIARLSVRDNGTAAITNHAGTGLRSLQMRARAAGGTLSISREAGFLLVCVIPLDKEASGVEAVDR